jgi:hypothetical protein
LYIFEILSAHEPELVVMNASAETELVQYSMLQNYK